MAHSTLPSLAPTAGSPFTSDGYLLQLLAKAVEAKASDVHLKVGRPPAARVNGELIYFRSDPLRAEDTDLAVGQILRGTSGFDVLARAFEHDVAFAAPGVGRFRVNVYRQRGTLAVAMRFIPLDVPTFEELGVPAVCRDLADRERGLVLVVGAAGNGKSSTLAAMIGHLNRTRRIHIVTIEDPIEFLHTDDKASISQRELGLDTLTPARALRAALRQDPDVILLGEIRDEETLDIALQAAETGHLVLSTLHTPDVARTVGRMLALAPRATPGSVEEMRDRIGDSLQGIVAQRLLPKPGGQGRVLAAEVLVATGTVRESIKRPAHNPTLKELMEKGAHPYGMQTFEMHVRHLAATGAIDAETARLAATF